MMASPQNDQNSLTTRAIERLALLLGGVLGFNGIVLLAALGVAQWRDEPVFVLAAGGGVSLTLVGITGVALAGLSRILRWTSRDSGTLVRRLGWIGFCAAAAIGGVVLAASPAAPSVFQVAGVVETFAAVAYAIIVFVALVSGAPAGTEEHIVGGFAGISAKWGCTSVLVILGTTAMGLALYAIVGWVASLAPTTIIIGLLVAVVLRRRN